MRVEFRREGGFTGIPLTLDFETDSLSPNEAAILQKAVETAGFFDLPAVISPPKIGADRFQYVLTVDQNGKHHSIEFSEPAPSALQNLLDFLVKLAKERRSQGRS